MTAEELARRANVTNDNYGGSPMVGTYLFETEEEFQAFCDQLCAEQRELCASDIDWKDVALYGQPYLEDKIRNAPQPKTGG